MKTNSRVRQVTAYLIDSMEMGVLDPRVVADACLAYMSESQVAEMAADNDLAPNFDEDEE